MAPRGPAARVWGDMRMGSLRVAGRRVLHGVRRRDAGLPGPARSVQHEEARRTAGCRRECVRDAAADVHEAAFGDRGHLAVSVHDRPRTRRRGLIGHGFAVERRSGGRGGIVQAATRRRQSAAPARMTSSRGGDSRRLCAAPGRCGHVMALLPLGGAIRAAAGPAGISRSRRITDLVRRRRPECVMTWKDGFEDSPLCQRDPVPVSACSSQASSARISADTRPGSAGPVGTLMRSSSRAPEPCPRAGPGHALGPPCEAAGCRAR